MSRRPMPHHKLVILHCENTYHTIEDIQTWHEDDDTGNWDTYDGLEHLA